MAPRCAIVQHRAPWRTLVCQGERSTAGQHVYNRAFEVNGICHPFRSIALPPAWARPHVCPAGQSCAQSSCAHGVIDEAAPAVGAVAWIGPECRAACDTVSGPLPSFLWHRTARRAAGVRQGNCVSLGISPVALVFLMQYCSLLLYFVCLVQQCNWVAGGLNTGGFAYECLEIVM